MRALTRVRGRIVELEVLTQELGVLREQRAALQEVIGAHVEPCAASRSAK